MLRKATILLITLSLCWTTVACGSPNSNQAYRNSNNVSNQTRSSQTKLKDGQYGVQQATYDDINGEYTLMLLDTPPGTPSAFSTTDLQMARLTNEEIKAGKKSYLSINNSKAALHLTEDFKVEYVHNVTQNQTNPQTGQQETVVVRQQSGFWAPFAGAVAGQALGSLLFTPRYYVPPVYQPGVMVGYGGYGNTYSQAVNGYQSRYQAPPPAVRNSQTFRTTGRLSSPSSSSSRTTGRTSPNSSSSNYPSSSPSRTTRQTSPNNTRSTGSGYGSSKLRRSNKSSPTRTKRPSSFGSGGGSRRPSGFGSRRR
ncbi:MAG: hypothetical protein WBG73_07125 [Coleofasciculaceae cyanobacterium]